ncbi:threonyl-tRNA synthetase, partial [Plasmodium cynomolgi strain B]
PSARSAGNVAHSNDAQRRRYSRNAYLVKKKNALYVNQLWSSEPSWKKKNSYKVSKVAFKRMASTTSVDKFQGDLLEKLKQNLVVGENPAFIQERLAKYNELKEKKRIEREEVLKSDAKLTRSINVQLLDGSVKVGQCNVTTPFHIASSISKRLAEDSIVARVTYVEKVDLELCDIEDEEQEAEAKDATVGGSAAVGGETPLLWDMNVPLLGSCKIEFLNMEHEEAKKTFWHSSAHMLGSSLEKLFGGYLTIGPPLKEGFYYDIYLREFSITNEHYKKIEEEFNKLIKENAEFEKLICTKDEVMDLFKYNPFKLNLIKSKIPENKKTSVYRCGNFIDLCLGPHIKSTGKAKAFKVLKNSAAYWLGNKNNDSLQRVYGITFQKKSELNDYLNFLEEAKKRDHRNVGKKLHFFFDKDTSPGSCFWLPHGAKIYNKLIDFVRREYRIRMYEEVITPNVFSCDLWKTSGHYQNYKECMFIFNVEEKEWGMKPMNCPGHCIMFKQLNASYRSLPIRLADFGVLHRNEISGSLSGLTRVRRFQQDDSHIFCTFEQIKEEVLGTLRFIFFIYDLFGFKYELFLSTRPKKFIGNISTWDFAEQALKDALNSANISWKLNEGDGAFYGPKIDILLKDSINRTHQCGTIQLDFQLPCRFNLQYKNRDFGALNEGGNGESGAVKREEVAEKAEGNPSQDQGAAADLAADASDATNAADTANTAEQLKRGFDRPVIIHRAILGSVERFVAILIEHTAGKLPFWISPRQAIVLPVSDKFNDYANYVYQTLNQHFFDVEIDTSLNTLNKKIREAQLNQFNFILVVGEKELTTNTVTVRNRDDQNNHEVCSLEELIARFRKLLEVNSMPLNQVKPFKQEKPPQ